MKTIMTIIILLSETSAANFKPEAYNWNAKELDRVRLAVPDLISLFTKEDVYTYQDIDIFGYTSRPIFDKVTPISHSD